MFQTNIWNMKRSIGIRQYDRTDCAAACLSSICSYYGLELPLTEIRDACGTSSEGTNLKGILDASRKLGLKAKALKSSGKDLSSVAGLVKPLILHLDKKDGWLHFIVLYEYGPQKCRIMDPEDGRITCINTGLLGSEWSGYLITACPGEGFEKHTRRTRSFSRYIMLFKAYHKELILSFAGAVVYIMTSLGISLFLQQTIDRILPEKNTGLLAFFTGIMLALSLLSLIINYIRSLFTINAGSRIDYGLVTSYISKLMTLPVSFFSTRSPGELNARLNDASRIRTFMAGDLIVIFISIFSLVISFALLFTFYWKLALIAICFIPLYALIYRLADKTNKSLNRKVLENSARFQDESVETFGIMQTIRYFGAEALFSEKLERRYRILTETLHRNLKKGAMFTSLGDTTTLILSFAIISTGSIYVIKGELSTGELISFFSIISFFTTPIIALIESNDSLREADIAAGRLFEIFDLDSENVRDSNFYDTHNLSTSDIALKQIFFSYPGQLSLFSDFSCTIYRKRLNIIKGANGSGKSTLAAMLMQTVRPDSGLITIGGNDIWNIPPDIWRKLISLVPQDPGLFNASIIENITLHSQPYDTEKVRNACTKAGLLEKIESLPEGLEFNIGSGGHRLSGGERQKTALARALYREPEILILDEATASLDMKSRLEFRNIITRLVKEGLTIILITHDDSFDYMENNTITL